MVLYKKNNYNKKLLAVEASKVRIANLKIMLEKEEFELNGSPTSPFYGLKNPSLPKIIEYLCDTYKLPYDVMMNCVYERIIKECFESNMKQMKSLLSWRFAETLEEVKAKDYDYENDFLPDGWWMGTSFTEASLTFIWKKEGICNLHKLSKDQTLYLANGRPYRTERWGLRRINGKIEPKGFRPSITILGKNKVKDKWDLHNCELGKLDTPYDWRNWNRLAIINKKQIVERLNQAGIDFKLSDSKEKLMSLLVRS